MIELLGTILTNRGAIDGHILEHALLMQQNIDNSDAEHQQLGALLISHFNVSEDAVYRALADQFSLEFVEKTGDKISPELVREIPVDMLKEARFYPVKHDGDFAKIIIADPIDLDTLLSLQAITGMVAETALTTPSELKRSIEKLFKDDSMLKQSVGKISMEFEKKLDTDEAGLSIEEIKKRTESEPVVKLVSLIFDEAIKLKASDIHIEPFERGANIRYRIDGLLTRHTETTKGMYLPLTSRIKIMADLDISEKRIPQDGRIRYANQGEQFDFRVSTLPTHYGEKTVIRILKHDTVLLSLAHIGLPEKEMLTVMELVEKPQGMIFVTGPTGSGKSSTLFACLNAIRKKAINITTIEDPVEYKIEGINQVQINEKAGVTFASTLRSILRQDPDVILVGEIRDRETAEIAIQASQTGHLVFSTLHTNDAISAITRLKDLGIPGFLISSSLLGVLAQRLVRVLCPQCKQKAEVNKETKERWRIVFGNAPMPESYNAIGCEACHNLGFKGRVGIFELAMVNDVLRDLISTDANEGDIRRHLHDAGMKTLLQNGIEKIEQGITTPNELLRVVMVEDIISLKENKNG
jgi:type IV pilus assembly protein PilB